MGKVIQFKSKSMKRTWETELVNKMFDKIITEARDNGKCHFELFINDELLYESVEMCLMVDHVINNLFNDKKVKISIGYYLKDKLEDVRYRITNYIETHQDDKEYCAIVDTDIM